MNQQHVERYLSELRDQWGVTEQQSNRIREMMASYALDAVMDSSVRDEAAMICKQAVERKRP